MPPKIPDEPPVELAHEGNCGNVEFARCADGKYPAKEYFESLSRQHQAAYGALFIKITSDPHLRLNDAGQFKVVEGEMFEFKRNGFKARLFCFRQGNTWYLVHGFGGKKENALPPREVALGLRRVAEAKANLAKRRSP